MQINFDPSRKSVFRRENGQYKLYATIFRDVSKTKTGVVDFIYDSGAFLTVINKERYETLGLDCLPKIEHHINGYTGKANGFFFPNTMAADRRRGFAICVGVFAEKQRS